jgi:hypothetical protein
MGKRLWRGRSKRWSTGRKRGVVLRLLRGESVDAGSREVDVTTAEFEQWRELALAGMEAALSRCWDGRVRSHDEERKVALPRSSLSGGGHQLRGAVVFQVSAQFA